MAYRLYTHQVAKNIKDAWDYKKKKPLANKILLISSNSLKQVLKKKEKYIYTHKNKRNDKEVERLIENRYLKIDIKN